MRFTLSVAMAAIVAASAATAEDRRAADAHEHGHGMFRMAIEDDRVEIEVEVPAFDVVGFEHAPSTAAHRATMAEAAGSLGRPDILFAMPEAAGCAVGRVEIGFGAAEEDHDEHGHDDDDDDDDDDHDDDHDHDEHGHDEHDDEDGETHSEVTASYLFLCEDTGALDRIEFGWFEAFPNSEELEVVVLSGAGQSAGEVDRSGTVFEIE